MAGPTTVGGVGEAVAAATDALRAAGIEEARSDAEALFAYAAGWDRARIAADPGAGVPPATARQFGAMVRRRLRREPVAYILGRRWFRNIELAVDPRVLIPRPETELLVELALELRPGAVLDIGTGSGAVALAIADELPECAVTGTDTSAAALEVARANAERLGLNERVRFHDESVRGGFDLVVANLPYVADPEWASLQPEVAEWEPREALLAGPDGLDAIRTVLPECVRLLSRHPRQRSNASTEEGKSSGASAARPRRRTAGDGGVLALEVGAGQAETVAAMLRDAGFSDVATRRDLAGIERVVMGRKQ